MDASEGRLKILDLSKEQLLELFDLSMSVFLIVRHDATRLFSVLRARLQILQERVEDLGEEFASLKEIVFKAAQGLDRASLQFKLIDGFGESSRDQSLFVAKPIEIIESINRTYGADDVAVGEGSPMSLELIYPRNILFGILLELTDNARALISGPRQIMVRWGLRGDRFECEVHDNGPGIDRTLGEKFAPLSSLGRRDGTMVSQTGRGLYILELIVVGSGGVLLFSNSPLLGGTLVRFELPVHSYNL